MKIFKPFFASILLWLCVYSTNTNAQSFYVSAPLNAINSTVGTVLYKVTITSSGPVSELVTTCSPNDYMFSIAMNKGGFYWINPSSDIHKGTLTGTTIANCSLTNHALVYANSMTMGPDGKIYYSNRFLYRTDPVTKVTETLGDTKYSPAGDISFYNGDLYQASYGSLIKIDVNNPGASFVYMTLPFPDVFGLVSVSTSLHKNTLYAFSLPDNFHTNIYEIDVENKVVKGLVGTLPYAALDAASPVEDGNIAGVVINGVNVHQDCDHPTTGIAEVTTVFNNETFTYTLNNGTTNHTGMFTGLAAGNYTVTVTSSNDVQTSNFTVPAYNLNKPAYTYKIDNQVCDKPGQITFTSADVSGYTIKYSGASYPLKNVFTGLTTGNSYQFTIINPAGCIVDVLTLTVPRDKCTIQYDKTNIQQQCDAIHKGTAQVVTKAHNDTYSYTLNGITNSTGAFSNLMAGNYTLHITSAEDALDVPVTIPDYKLTQPAITFMPIDENCGTKGSIQFSMQNAAAYKIQYAGNTYPLDNVFNGLSAGSYHFLVLSQANCMIDEYDVQLKYVPCPITINSITIAPECHVLGQGQILVKALKALPSITYTYKLNSSNTNNTGLFNFLLPDSYQVTVNSSDGGIPQTATVTVPDYTLYKPISTITTKMPVCDLTGQIKITVPADTTTYSLLYNGQVYPSGNIFTGLYEGSYHFDILKKNGCIADAYDVNLVREECDPVSFPSAFTPNGDGINDVFRADPKSKATLYTLQIYDRFGVLIFSSADLHQGWDGYYQGRLMPMAVYYYVSTFVDQKNQHVTLRGNTTLIR